LASPLLDYYDIESLLTADERMVRDTARKFVDEEYLPLVRDAFRHGKFPMQVIPKIAELGFLGANLPEKYGCAGLDNVAYGLINQELERGDSGLRSFVSVQSSLVMYPIYAFGSEEQKTRWLPALASGKAIGCFGLTEPDYGSNPGGMLTRARKDGAHWVLDGTKRWITNGTIADVAIVWAKTEGDDAKSIRGFLVERGTPGFSAPEMEGKFSLRA
jgi:glutaryl-CoA dehydrogenase